MELLARVSPRTRAVTSIALAMLALVLVIVSAVIGPREGGGAVAADEEALGTLELGDPSLPARGEPSGDALVMGPKGTVSVSAGGELGDIPDVALAAYQRAATVLADVDAGCEVGAALLAAIGKVESDHGRYGGSTLGEDGVSRPAIIGVRLDGRGGVAAIRDTDGGLHDGDRVWDRAVGPMQIIPATWATAGVDGDGDGIRSPGDIDDAALAAAVFLCARGEGLDEPEAISAALRRYNDSDAYVTAVMSFERAYRALLDGGSETAHKAVLVSKASARPVAEAVPEASKAARAVARAGGLIPGISSGDGPPTTETGTHRPRADNAATATPRAPGDGAATPGSRTRDRDADAPPPKKPLGPSVPGPEPKPSPTAPQPTTPNPRPTRPEPSPTRPDPEPSPTRPDPEPQTPDRPDEPSPSEPEPEPNEPQEPEEPEEPNPRTVTVRGMLTVCEDDFCFEGRALRLREHANLDEQATADFDADGATEDLASELAGLAGSEITVEVVRGEHGWQVVSLNGLQYGDVPPRVDQAG